MVKKVKRLKKIIGTPFKSVDTLALKRTNLRTKGIIDRARLTKRNILLRGLRDKIDSKDLPAQPRAGTIE